MEESVGHDREYVNENKHINTDESLDSRRKLNKTTIFRRRVVIESEKEPCA